MWKKIWYLTLILVAVQLVIFFPGLPEKVPSHFDFSGTPDGWMSKTGFLFLWIGLMIFMNMWVPLTKILITRCSPKWANIPNKEYWYANEKNKARLVEIMDSFMAMIFAVLNLMFIYIFHYTYEIAVNGSSSLKMWVIFIPVVFVSIFPIIFIFTKLKVPEKSYRDKLNS
jgi:uncharacterized membrane protein